MITKQTRFRYNLIQDVIAEFLMQVDAHRYPVKLINAFLDYNLRWLYKWKKYPPKMK